MARILIVDDELQILRLLSTVLTRAGHQVQTAGTPQKVIEMCSPPGSFDLVLSDVDMPVMDGHELARWVSARRPACRVMLMSAFDSDCATCPYSPCCELVRKPFDPKDLVRRVAAVLAQPPELGPESSETPGGDTEVELTLQRQLTEAYSMLDRACDQLRRLDRLGSIETDGGPPAELLEQARRVHRRADQVYSFARRRYTEFLRGRRTTQSNGQQTS